MAEVPQWSEYPEAVEQSPTGSLLDSLGYLPAAAVGATAGGSLAYLLRRSAADLYGASRYATMSRE